MASGELPKNVNVSFLVRFDQAIKIVLLCPDPTPLLASAESALADLLQRPALDITLSPATTSSMVANATKD
jgi:hypothetical protein